jgi:serine protease Do
LARLEEPGLRELAAKFTLVRIVEMREIDLRRIQFDWDQTWCVVFLNADGTVYGRYGSRAAPRKQAAKDVTAEGLRAAMEGALELHAAFPGNRESLAAKSVPDSPVARIRDFEAMKGRFTEDLPRGCVHCHFAWEGLRADARAGGKPLPEKLLYPYPMPAVVGFEMDTAARAAVKSVAAGSAAAAAGLRAGDRIVEMEGQPILSVADVQWVLHHAAEPARIRLELERGGKPVAATLELAAGWRRHDFTWRESTWPLRPGFKAEPASRGEKEKRGLPPDRAVLKVGSWVAPKREGAKAGLKPQDWILEIDGKEPPADERGLLELLVLERRRGAAVELTVLRGEKRETLRMAVP